MTGTFTESSTNFNNGETSDEEYWQTVGTCNNTEMLQARPLLSFQN